MPCCKEEHKMEEPKGEDVYVCEECGCEVKVVKDCGCGAHDLTCCGKPLKKKE